MLSSRTSVSRDWRIAVASKFTRHAATEHAWDELQQSRSPSPSTHDVAGAWASACARVAEHSPSFLYSSCWLHEVEVPGLHRCQWWPHLILTVWILVLGLDRTDAIITPTQHVILLFINGFHWKMNWLCFDQNKLLLLSLNKIWQNILCLVSYLCCSV